jgi:hypothetical protein
MTGRYDRRAMAERAVVVEVSMSREAALWCHGARLGME